MLLLFILLSKGAILSGQQQFDSLFLKQTVLDYFDSGSSALDSLDYASVDSLVEYSLSLDSFAIEVLAHTDNVGNEDFNLKLSLSRAESVVQYLNTLSLKCTLGVYT